MAERRYTRRRDGTWKEELSPYTTHWSLPVTELQSGDRIVTSGAVLLVESALLLEADETFPRGRVQVTGRIIKGYGRSDKPHTWSYHADQRKDVER
jgi:hypothetical protein